MDKPTTQDIQERHNSVPLAYVSKYDLYKDRGILLKRLEAAHNLSTVIETQKENYRTKLEAAEQKLKDIAKFVAELRVSADAITCSSVAKILIHGAANDLQAILEDK